MTSAICSLTSDDLAQLAAALRSGRLGPPFSALLLRRYIHETMAGPVAAELQQRADEGRGVDHLADCLEILRQDRTARPLAEDLIDLVWTGPDVPGVADRDTRVVVQELFRGAKQSVLLAGYAVYQGQVIFRELAERMDRDPGFSVRMYLDVQRPWNDTSSPAEILRRFLERFAAQEWPGTRRPRLYYDPRSLEDDPARRASLHAKCVVVDRELALVTSANFTEAAQQRNIEVGVLLRSRSFATRLVEHFETMTDVGLLRPVPGT